MKKLLHLRCFFTLLLFLMVTTLQAQWQDGLWTEKQAYNWYFGNHAGLNFEQATPLQLTDGQIGYMPMYSIPGATNPDPAVRYPFDNLQFNYDNVVGSAVISDPQGNLLFYTNGNTVWNKNHQVMLNGMDLISTPFYKENTIIVPAPGNADKYFIFTIKAPGYLTIPFPYPIEDPFYQPRVYYSEVDMSLDNGLGGVTQNKNVLLAGSDEPTYSKITATYHSDGNQVWVMMHSIYNNDFRAYLVSESGVSMTPVVSSIGFSINDYPDTMAQLKFSPDGTKIVKSIQLYSDQKNVEVFNFDKTTGKVTDVLVTLGQEEFINDGELLGIQGLEFSPNSKLLYATCITSGALKQFNLEAGDEAAIKASGITLSNFSDPMQFNTFMQVAPDGKIYVAYSEIAYGGFGFPMTSTTIGAINYPNNVGVACGFEPNAIDLGSDGHSFPSFIQDYFASGILHEGHCPSAAVTFSTLRIPGITDITWDFGDPESGLNNVSTDIEPSHFFSSGGTYTVTAIITSNGAQQTATAVVVIQPIPDAIAPPLNVLAKCADNIGNATFNLTELNTYILAGQSETQFSVSYYASQEDLVANAAITAPNTFITAGQIIYAVVTNTVTGCTTMIEFSLVVNPLPVAGNPTQNMELCGNTSATAVFNLTQQTSAILDGQDPAEFNVIYYIDAGLTNQIQQPETFESGGQTIYATVINKATGCSALAVPEFDIIVLPLPTLPEITTFDGCSPFDLVTISGEPEAGTVFSFHISEEDALDNINAITNTDNYVVDGNTGSVYVRATNKEGCVQVGELLLKPGNCFIPRGISPNNDGKNDTFDLSGFDVKVLKIFNRYGKEVYSKSNYTNEWIGKSNKGDELPSGTYFYMIESGNGESKTGWVYINR